MNCVLAFDTIKDPRDLAETLHLAAGFGAEVHLIGNSIEPTSYKVLRRLMSWRPELAQRPERLAARRFETVSSWAEAMKERDLEIIALAVEGGEPPWSLPRSFSRRLAFLLGEETWGLSRSELACCGRRWSIPLGKGGRFYTLGQATALLLGGWLEWRKGMER